MKTQLQYPSRQRSTSQLLVSLLVSLVLLALLMLATSCAFTVATDGSKSGTLDGNAVIPIARAVINATK